MIFITYIHWHKSFGLILLTLVGAAAAVEMGEPQTQVTEELTPFEEKASKWTHRSLYTLMFVVPDVTGWIASSAFGSPTKFFGLFVIPGIVEKSKPLVGPCLLGCISASHGCCLPSSASTSSRAFYHHGRRKDNVLARNVVRQRQGRIDHSGAAH